MTLRDGLLSDDWTVPLISRPVRLDADGLPWTDQPDPVLRERIRDVYGRLYESGETGRQIVAVHQEIMVKLGALVDKRKWRVGGATRRSKKAGRASRRPVK